MEDIEIKSATFEQAQTLAEAITEMEDKLSIMVRKFGVNTKFHTTLYKNRSGEPYFKFESDEFMNPMFAKILLHGYGYIYTSDDGNRFKVNVRLSYAYEHFAGGSNGCDLCETSFTIKKYSDDHCFINNGPCTFRY